MNFLQAYPKEAFINGEMFVFEKVLKDDLYSINVLYTNDRGGKYVLKLSDFRFVFGLILRPLAGVMSRHEYKMYQIASDISGIPCLGPRFGRRGFFHEFVKGKTLFEMDYSYRLPENFFNELRVLVDELHKRRILYLDLQKRGNIILAENGHPYLIDFQISIHFPKWKGLLGHFVDKVFDRLIQEDIYHLYKMKTRFQKQHMSEQELNLAERSYMNSLLFKYVGRPFRIVKRLIYPRGSNEVIWYKWKKQESQSRKTS